MPNLPCRCPHCRAPFSIPDDLRTKKSRCPRCGVLLQLSSARGKTTVVLLANRGATATLVAGKPELESTVLFNPPVPGPPAVAAPKQRRFLSWLLGALGCLGLMCCGGMGGVGLWWWGSQPASRQQQATLPGDAPRRHAEDPSARKVDLTEAIRVNARQFYSEFTQDLLKGDAKYLKKHVVLTDVVGTVEKDPDGRYYFAALKERAVKQRGRGGIMSPEEAHRRAIEAMLNQKYEPALLIYLKADKVADFQGVRLGERLTVSGRCIESRKDSQTVPDVLVIIEDATLISKLPSPQSPAKPGRN